MRAYYQGRKEGKANVDAGKKSGWNKLACLKAIEAALPKNVTHFQACAGTFWITWRLRHRQRVQTVHSQKNYWTCKVMGRWDIKKKEWVNVPGVWA